jgi:hypothetical protein
MPYLRLADILRVRPVLVLGGAGAGAVVASHARVFFAALSASSSRPRRSPGPLPRSGSGGRHALAEAERLQDVIELELRQPTGDVRDTELSSSVWIWVVDRFTPRLLSRLCDPAMLLMPPPPARPQRRSPGLSVRNRSSSGLLIENVEPEVAGSDMCPAGLLPT